jgi:hypothetical protein
VAEVKEDKAKEEWLNRFLRLPHYSKEMFACQEIVKTSYDNLPSHPNGLKEVFILIAGVWPRTQTFREFQRAVENIRTAVYGANIAESQFWPA